MAQTASPAPGASGGTATAAHLIHPQTLISIRNLELRAKVVVEGFWAGLHKSPYHGFSVEFTEYRQYTPGDDTRYLDWKLLGRSDRYYIKKFEDETNVRCHLLVDNSRSMDYGSGPVRKTDYANTLAATLAYFLYLQGDAVGLLTFHDDIRDYLPARHKTGHLRHLMLALEQPAGGAGTDLARPLERITELVRKRGMMVLITDLLAPIETLEAHLALLAAAGHEIFLFQILDPAEIDLSLDQAALYRDVETGRDLYVDPQQARRAYQERLAAHETSVRETCRKLDITFLRLSTQDPLELALFHFLRARTQQGRRVRRAGMTRRA